MNERTKRLTQEEVTREMVQHGRVRTDAEVKLEESALELRRIGMLLLGNEDGKKLLAVLEDLYYDGTIAADSPHTTYFNLGRRDVVYFLRGLRDQAKKEK